MATKKTETAPAAVTTVKAKKALPNSPLAKRQAEDSMKALAVIGKQILENPGKPTFTLPKTAPKLAEHVIQLAKSRGAIDTELAFALLELKKCEGYVGSENFTSIEEFAVAKCDISKERAKALIGLAETALELKLTAGHFGPKERLSFSKFREVAMAYRRGVLTAGTVLSYYPLSATESDKAKSVEYIQHRLKMLAAEQNGKEGEDTNKLARLSYQIPANIHAAWVSLLDTYKDANKLPSDGEALYHALTVAAGSQVSDDLARNVGMTSMRDSMCRLNSDVVPILLSRTGAELDADAIGLPVFNKVYVHTALDGTQRCGIATSRAEAAQALGVEADALSEMPLTVAPSLIPPVLTFEKRQEMVEAQKAVTSEPAPEPVAPPVEAPTPEPAAEKPAKKAPKEKAPEKPKKSKKKATEEPPLAVPVEPTAQETSAPAPEEDEAPPVPEAPTPGTGNDGPDFDADDVGTIVHYTSSEGIVNVIIDEVGSVTETLLAYALDTQGQKTGSRRVIPWSAVIGFGSSSEAVRIEPVAETKTDPMAAVEAGYEKLSLNDLSMEVVRLGKLARGSKTPELATKIKEDYLALKDGIRDEPTAVIRKKLIGVLMRGRRGLRDAGIEG